MLNMILDIQKNIKRTILILCAFIFSTATHSQSWLVNSNNEFSFKIYTATRSESSNFFISPFSLNIALSIANEGANSSTRDELEQLLCIESNDNLPKSYKDLVSTISNLHDNKYKECMEFSEDKSGENILNIANSIWINDKLNVENSYKSTIENYYDSDLFRFNGLNIKSANKKLNEWVLTKTNNKISNPAQLSADVMMSIVNAIYFMGEWDVPFDKKKTKKKKFYTISKDKIEKVFMKNRTHLKYYEDSDIQCVNIPYLCDQFSMLVILPQNKNGILEVENKLDKEYFDSIESKSNVEEVIITIPKFRIETTILPVQAIMHLGYTEMFSNDADFSNISKDSQLMIGQIIHKTYIEVDEKKTEAAGMSQIIVIATGLVGEPIQPPPPKVFNANHPFVFLIKDNRTGTIVFIGRLVE